MKRHILISIFAGIGLIIFTVSMVSGHESNNQESYRTEGDVSRSPKQRESPLTQKQKEEVIKILKGFDPTSLTAEDAKAIHRAFRDARIHPGPGMRETIAGAGFDPERLRCLDPPPPGHERKRHPSMMPGTNGSQEIQP